MPPILDMELVDPEVCAVPEERLRTILPQRYELQMVDSVCYLDHDAKIIVAYKDLKVDDWWTRGHFPGRPIAPGILMCEGAAQTATILWKEVLELPDVTVGFGGMNKIRFRGLVTPPSRMYFVATASRLGSRMAQFPTQAYVEGKLVFEGTIIGVAI